jgi:hypothetical protein
MIGSTPDPSCAPSSLPYRDTKPQGAADFYFISNSTFRFIKKKLGGEGLRRYWRQLGERYYRPVTKLWKAGGLASVADYWKDFFAAEPGSEVDISTGSDEVVLDVRRCPAVAHLRRHNREIIPEFCEHCFHVSEAIGANAGIAVRIQGGNGTCRQVFSRKSAIPAQNLAEIARCT